MSQHVDELVPHPGGMTNPSSAFSDTLTFDAHTTTLLGQKIPFKQALLVALAAGLGYGFDAYAVNIFGMLSPIIGKDLNISVQAIGVIGSIFLIGYTLGTVAFGYLADRVGRRNALRFSILLYGLTTVLGGLASSLYVITGLRFLTGVGGAGELAVGAPYTAEMWPPKYRAFGTGGIMFSLYSLGYIVAAIASLAIVPVFGWRWAFVFAAVPAGLVFWLRNVVQDSPRFKEAQDEMERIVALEGVRRPRENIWRIPGAMKRITIGWMLYVANACGYWGITFFLTTFMITKFHVSPAEAVFYAMLFYVAQFFLSLIGTALSDVIGRRPAGILGAVIMIVCTVLATTSASLTGFLIYGAMMVGMLGWLWASATPTSASSSERRCAAPGSGSWSAAVGWHRSRRRSSSAGASPNTARPDRFWRPPDYGS